MSVAHDVRVDVHQGSKVPVSMHCYFIIVMDAIGEFARRDTTPDMLYAEDLIIAEVSPTRRV